MKTAYFPPDGGDNAGIDVTFTRSRQVIRLGGWYDGMVGIEGEALALADFFERVGIRPADLKRAIKDLETKA